MKIFATAIILLAFTTTISAMQISSLPNDYYEKEATEILSHFDLKNPKFYSPLTLFLTQRIAMAGKAISITDTTIAIVYEDLLQREAAYANSKIISSFITGYVKNGGNGQFMLYFASIVEKNVLHVLMESVGYYYNEEIEPFELTLNLQKTSKEKFIAIIKDNYSSEQLLILSVLESKKFASIIQQTLIKLTTSSQAAL